MVQPPTRAEDGQCGGDSGNGVPVAVSGPVLIVDTREQRPYKFATPSETGTLHVGDYSIQGHESRVAVERKSFQDLIGSITTGRERFENEFKRARDAGMAFFVVVEGRYEDLAAGKYRSQMSPKSATGTVLSWSVRYHVPFVFVGNWKNGCDATERLLLAWWKGQQA